MALAKSSQLPVRDRAGDSERARRGARGLVGRSLLYLTLVAGAIVFTLPTFWMISTSLKMPWQATAFPPEFIPNPWAFETYAESWEQFPFWVSLKNTMVIELGVLVGRLLSASLVAYGFARLRFPGREWLFLVVLSTLMIPYHVTLVPQYLPVQGARMAEHAPSLDRSLVVRRRRVLYLSAATVLPQHQPRNG